jgi:murein L,D-transpeptidase YcbB/YkuD
LPASFGWPFQFERRRSAFPRPVVAVEETRSVFTVTVRNTFGVRSNLSRRDVLRTGLIAGLSAGGLAVSGRAASAQQLLAQTEWTEGFDTSAPTQAPILSARPTFSPETAYYTEQAIASYYQIAQQGGWAAVPADQPLKIGVRNPAVAALRSRLATTGDLTTVGGASDSFDSFVDGAVRRFQQRHGLMADGVVANETLRRINVPVDVRLRQLEMNLQRIKAFPTDLGARFVMVNIPGAEIETVEAGIVHSRHHAVVGKIDRQTPLLVTKVTEINFNPFWTVPKSIIIKDLIPKMQQDPGYLDRQKIRIYDRTGQEVSWQSINWQSEDAVNYMFRQDPGDINSMGSVKINFPSPDGVYMHDTPQKGLFGGDDRFNSSGCVRVQNVREYVLWLLKNTPEWPPELIEQVMTNGERVDAKVADPVPLYFEYVTAWATPDGIVQFRDDIYQRDGLDVALQ